MGGAMGGGMHGGGMHGGGGGGGGHQYGGGDDSDSAYMTKDNKIGFYFRLVTK